VCRTSEMTHVFLCGEEEKVDEEGGVGNKTMYV
jgi:hypothetical protein